MEIFSPLPAHRLDFRGKTLDLSIPRVMGILNVTPDSFSDGGQFTTIKNALAHCQVMLDNGADIIDIGGESTRPGATSVDVQTELLRVVPVVRAIRERFGKDVWLSVDTSSPDVMQESILAGADIINDVRGLKKDGAKQVVASLNCPVVIMHSRGEPATMNALDTYHDPITQITQELQTAVNAATLAGILSNNIIIDVGMGFAKNHIQHRLLLQNLAHIRQQFGLPMLFGLSRKRFLGECLDNMQLPYLQHHNPPDRDHIGVLAHLFAIQQGASIVRVHDVKNMVQAVRFWKQMTK